VAASAVVAAAAVIAGAVVAVAAAIAAIVGRRRGPDKIRCGGENGG
jgi:hypothetical protein